MLIGLTTTVAAPPSVAVIVLVTDCPPPPPDSVTADGHAPVKAAPRAVQVNFTLTEVEYQPSRLLGLRLVSRAVIEGSLRLVEADDPVKSTSPL
jgi:hypothetical protein